ncbi:zinc finger protein 830 [Rhinichthys klamathensis goyatoka]|uniref:zinc finger protein 830 n=1 Tax=Rhinichthys klamathensis goyatoka TaxID=3034132 RepID=UPI0024B4818E|nr:zinc finger protein 830 [Rhinichthys klamathensis goyatoka]
MASLQKGKKKVVNQEDLRRLMREKKRSTERDKRVDSPHARYSSAGQLSCALCNAPVRSSLLWHTHVLGKTHKDRVSELKNRESTPSSSSVLKSRTAPAPSSSSSSSSVLKRGAPEPASSASGEAKRAKTRVTAGQQERTSVSSGQSAGLVLLAGQYDDDGEEEGSSAAPAGEPVPNAGLPADFFDSSSVSVSHSGSVSESQAVSESHSGSVSQAEDGGEERKDGPAEALPEGFFDDPVRDAKVRNVDTPRDHMDREWEEFQKEMRQVNSASDAIVAEDDEEGRLERQIHEIDQQMLCFRRVEVLRARQELVKSALSRARLQRDEARLAGGEEEDDEEEEEEELMHVLAQDWRAKGALA